MDERIINEIEKIFRDSNSSDELFDTFNYALKNRLLNIELYKILLANPALSKDELIMFTEKLCRDIHNCQYEIYLWTAGIFENYFDDYYSLEKSLHYYQKAAIANPLEEKPFLSAIKLYNYELKVPYNENIINMIESSVEKVKRKSKVYYALAAHFTKTGNEKKKKYFALAEKASRNEINNKNQ